MSQVKYDRKLLNKLIEQNDDIWLFYGNLQQKK